MSKKFQELDLKDAFLFAAALEDEETCRLILQLILGFSVGRVKVHAEHSLLYSSDFRSVRLDIYASDETCVEYNLEMQNEDEKNLPKRSRYHQAEMDVMSLKPGEDVNNLKPGYVVFICTFDPFGKRLYRYTFENRCLEKDMSLEDGTKKIFLSTKGTNEAEVPKELVHFLRYVENSTDKYVDSVQDKSLHAIHEKIVRLKKSRAWEGRYMKFEELLQKSKKEGLEQGLEQGLDLGQSRILKLMNCMIQAGEHSELPRLEKETAFLEEMLEKYHL